MFQSVEPKEKKVWYPRGVTWTCHVIEHQDISKRGTRKIRKFQRYLGVLKAPYKFGKFGSQKVIGPV